MRGSLLLCVLVFLCHELSAQYVYTIKADSVKITNCDSAELILENHTQNVPGFLFNTGNGRTIFRRGALKLTDTSYLIGVDTIKWRTNAWVQGGNTFGAAGILGTNDTFSLNFYTDGTERGRFTNTGNLLLGTSTDNGSLLQVAGNTSIGSATITSAGNLIGTNAILFNHFIPHYRTYHLTSPTIAKLDDVIYNYDRRLQTTTTVDPSTGVATIDIVFPPDEIASTGITYSNGSMYFSFWPNGMPGAISVEVRNAMTNTWNGPYTADISNNLNKGGAGLYEVPISMPNWLIELKITIAPQPGGFVNLQDMSYVLNTDSEGLLNPYPYVSKYVDEHIYNNFFLKSEGVDHIMLSPNLIYPSWFMGHIGIGTSSPTAQLHTTGTVRFSGIEGSNAPSRVLVVDTAGNVFYRDASTLAENQPIRSSLAVNGPITAKQLTLTTQDWPDYVFDSAYQLPSLTQVSDYIQEHHHLPGIVPAELEKKAGVDVGQTQAALLKKIEELTLYTIDQNRKLARQDSEIEQLKEKFKELEKEIKKQ